MRSVARAIRAGPPEARTSPPPSRSSVLASLATVSCSLPRGEPATAQRPTFCLSPATTAAGSFELESGVSYGPLDDFFELPNTLKYGLSERSEAQLGLSPLIGVGH